ncbi:MAG: hypothetical protein ABSG33_11930 [Candidatus Bathyarchaeia archaeon]
MKNRTVLVMLLVALVFAMVSTSVYAQTLQVQIGVPSNSNGDLGITSGSYWVGQFPITINPNTPQSATGEAYCMTSYGTVYEGTSYPATEVPVPNTPTWQQIAYILSWNTPTSDSEAAIDQVAIWMLLGQNPPYADFSLDSSITGPAASLVSSLSAGGGMNVARTGDQLQWIAPFVGTEGSTNITSADAGKPVTFQVQLGDSSGHALAIQNVQIDFTALGSTTPEYTDSNGIATYAYVVPQSAQAGSTITVTASTQSVWPVEYLDLTTASPGTQNLIGVGPTLGLTTSYNIQVAGSIFVLPESAYGALSALTACAASFLIYHRLKPQTRKRSL